MRGKGYAVSAYLGHSPGRPTGLGPNTLICIVHSTAGWGERNGGAKQRVFADTLHVKLF